MHTWRSTVPRAPAPRAERAAGGQVTAGTAPPAALARLAHCVLRFRQPATAAAGCSELSTVDKQLVGGCVLPRGTSVQRSRSWLLAAVPPPSARWGRQPASGPGSRREVTRRALTTAAPRSAFPACRFKMVSGVTVANAPKVCSKTYVVARALPLALLGAGRAAGSVV